MADHKIIWTEKTVNLFTGCTKCSPGCINCYAERMANRLKKIPATAEKYRNGFKFTQHPIELTRFYYDLCAAKKPKKIFVNSMSDTFHEDASPETIKTLFKIMNELSQHTFQILTKRPHNIPKGLNWTKNIYLGVTVCNQDEADKKIPILAGVGATFSFLSIEPMLEHIDFHLVSGKLFDLVIVGGESGPGARPIHPDWVRSIRNQCSESGTPFLFKQWGDCDNRSQIDAINAIMAGRNRLDKHGGRTLDGKIHDGII